MAISEIEIKRALRPHYDKLDSGVAYREAFDRAMAYVAGRPRATLDRVIIFALKLTPEQARFWNKPQRRAA